MAFADLTVKLRGDITDFSAKLKEAYKQTEKVKKSFAADLGSKVSASGTGMLEHATSLSNKYKEATKELKSHNLGLKDTARIVQGIMVSQAFYAAAGAIRDATRALWEFNVQLDYMRVTYSALFGSTNVADDFMAVLQEHSIETIFDYQSLADASKKLLAYGIEYENLMFVMEGLTNLGAMSGDANALDRIALALGQIYTKGKLSAEEMRQLANAYIPITDILQEKFGLTGEDLKRVGDLNLPAADVINAIVDYANENFASVGDAAMFTITGLQNKIVDTLKTVGAHMLTPVSSAYKSFLAYLSNGLEKIRSAFATGGLGGVFEQLVPDETKQQIIRQFFANVHNFFMSLISVGVTVGKVMSLVWDVFVAAFNIVGPAITFVINLLASFISVTLSSSKAASILRTALLGTAAAFLLLKIQALGSLIITAVTNAVIKLSKALVVLGVIISKHPMLAALAAIGVLLLATSANADKANASLSKLFGGLGNTKSEDIFKDAEQNIVDADEAIDQFNDRFKQGTENADELGDSINDVSKAAKKAKGLLSFDEVFKLPEAAKSDDDKSYGYDGVDFEGMAGYINNLSESLIPDIPDFTDFINEFTGDLFGGLLDKVKQIAQAGATGALVGALAGFAIGGLVTKTMSGALAGAKLGAKIGTVAGPVLNAFWPDAYKELEKALLGFSFGATSGALIGALAGFIIGAFATKTLTGAINAAQVGTRIGGVIGGVVGLIFDDAGKVLSDSINQITSGAAEGALLGALAGFIIGAFALKSLQGAIAGAKIGAAIGTAIGGVVGGVFGDAEDTVGNAISNLFSHITAASQGAVLGALTGMILGAVVGAFVGGIGAIPGAKLGARLGATLGSLGSMLVSYLNTSGIFESVGGWFGKLGNNITKWWDSLWKVETWTSAWDHVYDWFAAFTDAIILWFKGLKKTVKSYWDKTFNFIDGMIDATYTIVSSKGATAGHATGGVFNREHVARFAEGNKAEAVIPLENRSAMQPFVDAVSNGLISSLAPLVASANANASNSSGLQPLYVGTLIADDRGLKELYKKFEVIQLQENDRRGTHATA